MSLVDHARRELELSGRMAARPAAAQALIAAVAAFTSYDGHSGDSHDLAVHELTRLLNHKPLSPLTDDPDEWKACGEEDGRTLYQSTRNPQAYSTDAGRTYYVIDEVDAARRKAAAAVKRPMHTSVPRWSTNDAEPPQTPDTDGHARSVTYNGHTYQPRRLRLPPEDHTAHAARFRSFRDAFNQTSDLGDAAAQRAPGRDA